MKYIVFLLLLSFGHLTCANSIAPQDAVSEHNKWRNLLNLGGLGVHPRPNPFISDMYWDQTLADSSQLHADKCIWQHSGTGGENLYAQSSGGSISEGVRLWVEEEADYDFAPISRDNFSKVGHYTQMVWHDSLRVGCAKAQCNPIIKPDGTTLFSGSLYVCQYRESGNWLGQYPYSVSGQSSTEVVYTGKNTNLQFQMIKVGNKVFRAKLRIKSFAPVLFETLTYERRENVEISLFANMAELKDDILAIPKLNINGKNQFKAVLKHRGNLEFEVIEVTER